MRDMLLSRPAWYVAGPAIGLLVIALWALVNARLAVLGGYSDLVRSLGRRGLGIGWQGCFVLGIVAGSLLFALLAGDWRAGDGYGWLTDRFDGVLVAVVLAAGGVLIGLGTRIAGGCTSGNGLSGCAFGSPASFVATGTFMLVAVGVAFATRMVAA